MRDEIMRLAERVETICTGLTETERRVKAAGIAAELRALARTDHPEDKLGMVEAGGASYQQDKNTRMTASEIITALVAIGDMESPAMLFVGGRSGWLTNVEDDHGQYVFSMLKVTKRRTVEMANLRETLQDILSAASYGIANGDPDGAQKSIGDALRLLAAAPTPDHSAGVGGVFDIYEAYKGWPDDLRKKLSLHDLRRMNGWVPANAVDPMAERSRKLIVGFMLDCNSIGMVGAAENLGKAIKEAALAQPADADADAEGVE